MKTADMTIGGEYAYKDSGMPTFGFPLYGVERVRVESLGNTKTTHSSWYGDSTQKGLVKITSLDRDTGEETGYGRLVNARTILMPWEEYIDRSTAIQTREAESTRARKECERIADTINVKLKKAGAPGRANHDGGDHFSICGLSEADLRALLAPWTDGIPDPTEDELGIERWGEHYYLNYVKPRRESQETS